MNKKILMILIVASILLIGIGVASAIEYNSTDETLSFEQDEVISVEDNCSDVLNVNDEENVISAENNDDDVVGVSDNNETELLAENNDDSDVVGVSDNNKNEIIAIDNNSDTLGVEVKDNKELLSKKETHYDAEKGLNVTTEYKKFTFPKLKAPYNKKYEKGIIPLKSDKKAWKKYKKYQKVVKKALKKWKKKLKKKFKKIEKQHWITDEDPVFKVKHKGKKAILCTSLNCFRIYYYNASTNSGWWEK